MLFSSSVFLLLFLPGVLAVYYLPLRRWRGGQNAFLLLASLGFYAWGEPWFVLVMLLCIVCNYFIGLWAGRDRKGRGPLLAGIFVNLGIIFVFKYLVFTLENLNLLFGGGLRIPVIDLPIGISFFTLQALSYILDVRRGRREAQKNPVNVGLYIAFFPQLIAGPIVRYETIADEIRGRHENWEDFSSGVGRFVFGLGKKVLLANPLALVADEAVRQCLAGTLSVSFAWVGASVYILQLYFDFSGYSDMAIGLGRMFGFHFLENFRYPYTAKTLTDFWRRWHISLGSWFQDYVYIPLGGSRVSRGRLVFNLLVTWFLTGLWHGASWTFVVWGLFYWSLLMLEKRTPAGDLVRRHPAFGNFCVIFFFITGCVIFRAADLPSALRFLGTMFGLTGAALHSVSAVFSLRENALCLVLAVLCSTPFFPRLFDRLERRAPALRWAYALIVGCVFLISVAYIVKGTYNPFIYFNF